MSNGFFSKSIWTALRMNKTIFSMKENERINDLDRAIAKTVLRVIGERGLKKFQVALDAGLENGYFSELINGKKRWNTSAILGVAKALGLQIQEMVGGDPLTEEDKKDLELVKQVRLAQQKIDVLKS